MPTPATRPRAAFWNSSPPPSATRTLGKPITAPPCGSSPGATEPKVAEIADIEPLHVAAYIEALGKDFEKPTVKQHLAAIRMLFDWLVTGQVVATNPAHAVRGPKHVVKTGKTTVLAGEQARELLDSIDTSILVVTGR